MSTFKWTNELVAEYVEFYHKNKCSWEFSDKNIVAKFIESKKGWEILTSYQYDPKITHKYCKVTEGSLNDCKRYGCHIHSVRRTTDDKTFTLRDKTPMGEIESFVLCDTGELVVKTNQGAWTPFEMIEKYEEEKPLLFTTEDSIPIYLPETWITIVDTVTWQTWQTNAASCSLDPTRKYFLKKANAEKYIQEHKPKPAFTTEDGVDVSAGSIVILLSTTSWIISTTSVPPNAIPFKGVTGNEFKYFSSKAAADNYIFHNKPIGLSLKEICTEWDCDFRMFQQKIANLIKSKING